MSSAGQAVLTGTERGFREVVSRNSSVLALHHRRTVLQRDVAAGTHDVRGEEMWTQPLRYCCQGIEYLGLQWGQRRLRSAEKPLRAVVDDLIKSKRMAQRMEGVASVLDVGCGTGRRLEELSLYLEDGVELRGVDVALRDEPPLPCTRTPELERFDGRHLAFEDDRFDVVMICYVLHHLNPAHAAALLGEALRVARRQVMILEDS